MKNKKIKGYVLAHYVSADPARPKVFPSRKEAERQLAQINKSFPEDRWEVKEVIARDGTKYSVLLKTIVNVRFGLIEAESPIAAVEAVDEFLSTCDMSFHDLFRKHRATLTSRQDSLAGEIRDHLDVVYTDWAEEHAYACVDEENGEIDDFRGTIFVEQGPGGKWCEAISLGEKKIVMRVALAALSDKSIRKSLGDVIGSVSKRDLNRIKALLTEFLREEKTPEEEEA